jgi:hypothetical protein
MVNDGRDDGTCFLVALWLGERVLAWGHAKRTSGGRVWACAPAQACCLATHRPGTIINKRCDLLTKTSAHLTTTFAFSHFSCIADSFARQALRPFTFFVP